MLKELLKHVDVPHYSGIMFSANYRALIEEVKNLYTALGIRYIPSLHQFRFPNEASVVITSLPGPNDWMRYCAMCFQCIIFEGSVSFADSQEFLTRLRANGSQERLPMRFFVNGTNIIQESWAQPLDPRANVTEVLDRLKFALSSPGKET